MAYFKINEPGKEPKYIKKLDDQNHVITFTTQLSDDCHQRSSGFYANSERDFLKFHYTEQYPEMQYLETYEY